MSHNISASFYTTTYVDSQELRVHTSGGGDFIHALIGGGTNGVQHLILPTDDAGKLANAILDAIAEAKTEAS